jgi:hypothetical protein
MKLATGARWAGAEKNVKLQSNYFNRLEGSDPGPLEKMPFFEV